jgi:hypothetical protein
MTAYLSLPHAVTSRLSIKAICGRQAERTWPPACPPTPAKWEILPQMVVSLMSS